MTLDLDTICEPLKSPEAWAKTATTPEMRNHFDRIVKGLQAQKPQQNVINNTSNGDLPRICLCASELNY